MARVPRRVLFRALRDGEEWEIRGPRSWGEVFGMLPQANTTIPTGTAMSRFRMVSP